MPIQTLSRSCDTNYLIGTSILQESLQLIDCLQLKMIFNKKKNKNIKRQNNAFFADLEVEEDINMEDQQEDTNDESETDDEIAKPLKKKKKKVHF
jgi:hypothetical protein